MKSRQWNEHGSSPWILSLPEEGKHGYIFYSTTPPYESLRGTFPDLCDKEVWNCCYGWFILLDKNDYQISLWNPLTSELIHLPPLESKPPQISIDSILLSSNYAVDPNSMVFLFDSNLPSLIYCLPGEKHWNTVCYGVPRKHRFVVPFILNGGLYAREAYGRNKLYCIHNIKPTNIDRRKYCQFPRVPEFASTCRSYYLMESYGELFFFMTSIGGINFSAILDIRVFKLNQESMRWHRVTRAQDRVFFIGEKFSTSYLATGDIIGGFIYHILDQYIIIYSFKDHSVSISTSHLMWNIPKTCSLPIVFFVPDLSSIDRHVEKKLDEPGRLVVKAREQTNYHVNILGTNKGESRLLGLPIDLLTFVTRFLNPVDYINFRDISRTCRSVLPRIQWRNSSVRSHSAPLSPWLISPKEIYGIYGFVDSKLGGKYFINIPKPLVDAKILHSKNGWLLMSKGLKALSFYNPFTKEIIKLPKPPKSFFLSSSIGFSSSPKSPECIVVAMHALETATIHIFSIVEKEWRQYEFGMLDIHDPDLDDRPQKFESSHNSPVFYDGGIYVLGQRGSLGVIELQVGGQVTWNQTIVTDRRYDFVGENFLLECDKKLFLIFIGRGEVNVFGLNHSTMSWERRENLGDYAFYVSRSSSFSTLVKSNGMGNRIFLPRLHHDKSIVSYSMKTKKYHCFARGDDVVEYYQDTRELLSASWIEPSWS